MLNTVQWLLTTSELTDSAPMLPTWKLKPWCSQMTLMTTLSSFLEGRVALWAISPQWSVSRKPWAGSKTSLCRQRKAISPLWFLMVETYRWSWSRCGPQIRSHILTTDQQVPESWPWVMKLTKMLVLWHLFFSYLFMFVAMGYFACKYVCAPSAHGAYGGQKDHWTCRNWSYTQLWATLWVLVNPGPLLQQ